MAIVMVHAYAEIEYLLKHKGMNHPKPNMPIMYIALCEPQVLLTSCCIIPKDLHATVGNHQQQHNSLILMLVLQEAEVLNGRVAMVAFALLVSKSRLLYGLPCDCCACTGSFEVGHHRKLQR